MTVEEGLQTAEMDRGESVFTPAVAVFHCRWCLPDEEKVRSLLTPEVAERASFIRLNCTGRMEAEFAVKAFGAGYDGVLVLGCQMGECHYRTGNEQAWKRLALLSNILALAGIYPDRLGVHWADAFDEGTTRRIINSYIEGLLAIGPFK